VKREREREVYLSRASMVFPSPSVPVYLDPHPPNWNNQVLRELLSASSPSMFNKAIYIPSLESWSVHTLVLLHGKLKDFEPV
jgi:hypothetical protein